MIEKWIVLTTINPPTQAIQEMAHLAKSGWGIVVVGDQKTPDPWTHPNVTYLSIKLQKEVFGELSTLIPLNHYCRKNLGYLYALAHGAKYILDTDDDNIPSRGFGVIPGERLRVPMLTGAEWVNVYKHFTDAHIWPRGLPLDEILTRGRFRTDSVEYAFPIQQFLADRDPDVDAIYRLILNKEIIFEDAPPVGLERGCWSPFNSQNTLFYADAFPLLYLPCHVSFRMTDIWRSLVAQQTLWLVEKHVAFFPATVTQARNVHNLVRDFVDEIPGYVENRRIANVLAERAKSLPRTLGVPRIASALWGALSDAGIIAADEVPLIDAWFSAYKQAVR